MPYFPQPFHLPIVDGPFADFWRHCKNHQLTIQRCKECQTWKHPPGPVCWSCQSNALAFVPVSGQGHILSYTIVYQELIPELINAAPYNVIVVALAESANVHMVSNLVGVGASEIAVGQPVQVVFDDVSPEITLPRFRLIDYVAQRQ